MQEKSSIRKMAQRTIILGILTVAVIAGYVHWGMQEEAIAVILFIAIVMGASFSLLGRKQDT